MPKSKLNTEQIIGCSEASWSGPQCGRGGPGSGSFAAHDLCLGGEV